MVEKFCWTGPRKRGDQRHICVFNWQKVNAVLSGIYIGKVLGTKRSIWYCYHVRYLNHLALQVRSSNWVHKTRIHAIRRWHHFGAKTRQSAFLLEKQLHSSIYLIWYSWSGSTTTLYYINLSVSWNTLLRNQILLGQCVFYYIVIPHTSCALRLHTLILCNNSVLRFHIVILLCNSLLWFLKRFYTTILKHDYTLWFCT